jgi:hypothetical protein
VPPITKAIKILTIMGKRSKDKGKIGEREAAAEVARLFNVNARRGVQYQGGEGSPDIVTDLDGVHFEVKRCEALSLYAAMTQAEGDAAGSVPVVLHRKNNRPWVAIVKLDDLPRLTIALTENVISSLGAT